MILVTLGTQKEQFTRLLDYIEKSNIKDEIIVQAGHTKYESKKMKIFDFIPYEKMNEYIDKADLVITHSGTGSVLMPLKKGKKVIVCARLQKYNEHVDDHQKQLVEVFKDEGYVLELDENNSLDDLIKEIKTFKPKKYKSNTEKFIGNLEKEIEGEDKKMFGKIKANFIKNKKNILVVLYSLLTYFSFLSYYNILFVSDNYRILTVLVFVLLLMFYKKMNYDYQIKTKKFASILSILVSIILIVGNRVNSIIWNETISVIFDLNSTISIIIAIIGFYIFFKRIICYILVKQEKVDLKETRKSKMKLKTFCVLVFVMILCWLIYLLSFYPGILTNDSYRVIHNTIYNILDDSHCFGYTFFFGIIWNFGMKLFNNMTLATLLYTLCQMVILSLIYNFTISYFYNKGLNKKVCIILWLIFAFNPLHAFYSITIWRDILFSAAFLLLIVSIYEFIYTDFSPSIKYIILFIISILMILFFRNNGIYVYILLLPLIFFATTKNKLILRSLYVTILVLYFVIKGPIYNLCGVEKGRTSEAFSIPLQQISRVIASDEKVDKETLNKLNKYVEVSSIKSLYKPYIADPIKSITNNEKLAEDKVGFIKIWGEIFLKHPRTYIEAYLSQTSGYWYPDSIYWGIGKFRESGRFEGEDIHNTSYNISIVDKLLDATNSRRIPFIMLIWSVGLQFLILLFGFVISIYNSGKKHILVYIPSIALWITIMIAAPVFCELRYVYSLFLTAPLLLAISMYDKNKKVVKVKK